MKIDLAFEWLLKLFYLCGFLLFFIIISKICKSNPSSPSKSQNIDKGYFKFNYALRKLRNTFSTSTLSVTNTHSSNSLDSGSEKLDDFEIQSAYLYHEKSKVKKSYKKKANKNRKF